MKLAQLSILAVLAIASQGAFAQSSSPDPRGMSSRGMSSGSSSGSTQAGGAVTTGDASTVTNAGSLATDSTVTTDQITTTTTDAMPTGEMANTGGEPELMLLAGVLLASGGLLLRRKTGNMTI